MSLSRCLASTSRLPATTRALSTSCSFLAKSTAFQPKRDPTTYGLPSEADVVPRKQWPLKADTDTSSHPLWRFFHEKESLEVPDKRKDNTGESLALGSGLKVV